MSSYEGYLSHNSFAAYLFVLCVRHMGWADMKNVVMLSRSGCGGQQISATFCSNKMLKSSVSHIFYFLNTSMPLMVLGFPQVC